MGRLIGWIIGAVEWLDEVFEEADQQRKEAGLEFFPFCG